MRLSQWHDTTYKWDFNNKVKIFFAGAGFASRSRGERRRGTGILFIKIIGVKP
jgi:hypothetical protein